jgi:hypothetical protein
MQFYVQEGDKLGLDLSQLGKLFGGQLVQGFGMALQNNHYPSDYFDGIGMFDEPVLPFENRGTRRNSFFT